MATFKVDGPSTAHPSYRSWASMMTRCHNPKSPKYPRYGGRGIKVCARWLFSRNFLVDMGPKPPGTSLGRIDNDGPYSPENCRWETSAQQATNKSNNRMVTAFGVTKTCGAWAYESGIPEATIYARAFRKNWPAERAVSQPTEGAIVRYRGGTLRSFR